MKCTPVELVSGACTLARTVEWLCNLTNYVRLTGLHNYRTNISEQVRGKCIYNNAHMNDRQGSDNTLITHTKWAPLPLYNTDIVYLETVTGYSTSVAYINHCSSEAFACSHVACGIRSASNNDGYQNMQNKTMEIGQYQRSPL